MCQAAQALGTERAEGECQQDHRRREKVKAKLRSSLIQDSGRAVSKEVDGDQP